MESKVKKMLYLRADIFEQAARRQDWIGCNDFQMAMYCHFKFLNLAEEFGELKNSLTQRENTEYLKAMLCWDYK